VSEPRPSEAARRAAEQAARASYGRLVAMLTARTRDIAAAEDALAEAFARALDSWSTSGGPDLRLRAHEPLGHGGG
jgi:RNA polymerase sigma-70 factor, ECF subfamily